MYTAKNFVLDYEVNKVMAGQSIFVLEQKWDRAIPIANIDDHDMDYHLYLVNVDSHTDWDVAVFAANDQEAIDAVIDFAEDEGYDGWLMDDEEEASTMAHGWTISNHFIQGGNHGRYLSEPAANIHIKTIAEANGQ